MKVHGRKVVWRVAPVEVGEHRAFHPRGWPMATWDGPEGAPAANITCRDGYVAALARLGQHAPLEVWIAKHRTDGTFRWHRLVRRATTLAEAKDLAARALKARPEWRPSADRR